jgi:hypothetical protein
MAIVPKYTSLDAAFRWYDRKAGLEDGSTQKLNELYRVNKNQAIEVLTTVMDPMREKSAFAWAALGMISGIFYGYVDFSETKKDGTVRVYPHGYHFVVFLEKYSPETMKEMADDIICQVIPQLAENMPANSTYRRKLEKVGSITQAINILKKVKKAANYNRNRPLWDFNRAYLYAIQAVMGRSLPDFMAGRDTTGNKLYDVKLYHKALVEFLDYQESDYIDPRGVFAKGLNHNFDTGKPFRGSARIQIS